MDFLLTFWAGLTFGQSIFVGLVAYYFYIVYWQMIRQAFQIRMLRNCILPENQETIKEINDSRMWVVFFKNPFMSIFTVVGTSMQLFAFVMSLIFASTSLFMNQAKNTSLKVSFVSLFSPYDPLQALLLAADYKITLKGDEMVSIVQKFSIPMVFFLLAIPKKNDKFNLHNIIVLSQTAIRLPAKSRMRLDIRCGRGQDETIEVLNGLTKVLNNSVDKSFTQRCDELSLAVTLFGLLENDFPEGKLTIEKLEIL